MGDFDQVVKYLDIVPASCDTTLVTKPLTISKARDIKKLRYSFNIPAFNVVNSGQSTLLLQYNYTAPNDFNVISISGYNPTILVYAMCIKYRVGTTVYRYRLPATTNQVSLALYEAQMQIAVQAPLYTNQRIKKNFCIEFWSSSFPANVAALADYTVLTSLVRNPVSADEQGNIAFTVTETATRAILKADFPEALPTPYSASSSWLTN